MIYDRPSGTALVDLYLDTPILNPLDPPLIPSGATVEISETYPDGDIGITYQGCMYTVKAFFVYCNP